MHKKYNFGKRMLILNLLLGVGVLGYTQQNNSPGLRNELFRKMEPKMIYPLINGGYLSGILPVKDLTFHIDPNQEVKLIFDFTWATPTDKLATEVNEGLLEVARILNLHAAAGTPKEKLHIVLVVHAGAITSVMNNAYYQNKYSADNPNKKILQQLSEVGCKIVICGQSLELREIPSHNLMKQIEVAVAAKTTLSSYHQKGYYQFEIKK